MISACMTVSVRELRTAVREWACCQCLLCKFGGPRGFGDLGEWLFIFMELGSTGNYFQGIGEQAHSFGDLGSTAKKFFKKTLP